MVKDHERKTCFLIDMSMTKDSTKEFNRISKYKDLEILIEKDVEPLSYHCSSYSRSTGYDQESDR